MKENVTSLVQRAQQGDVEALGKIVETFQDAVFGTSLRVYTKFSRRRRYRSRNFYYGKGTSAVFRNVVIRSRILDVNTYWAARDGGVPDKF